jgi:hypothetical protein
MKQHLLPFQSGTAMQRHRKFGQHKFPWGLKAPRTRLIPFQIGNIGAITEDIQVTLISAKDDSTAIPFDGAIEINQSANRWWITYKANEDLPEPIPCGFWYFATEVNGEAYYSEVIEVVEQASLEDSFLLSIRNAKDSGASLYQTGWEQRAYVRGAFDKPQVDRDVDEATNASGVTLSKTTKIEVREVLAIAEIPDYMFYPLALGSSLDIRIELNGIEVKCQAAEVEFESYSTELSSAKLSYICGYAQTLACETNHDLQ